ncbi:bacteriocin [Pseudoalteromonas sp. MMG013]|uniref:bacteriocin n=1 Tax=Pseudoalteromonas sp. MMG013 TaxID=2822687 RepID=UPI001B366ECD|nr:bacteriocin [Pseudoalteromonas sp. MMG013]MBQ4862231.1 bacteriocin [Pseudoalteromonas sp. MMG013]
MKNVQKLKLELTNEELQHVAGGKADISKDVLANFTVSRSTKDASFLASSTKDHSFLAY